MALSQVQCLDDNHVNLRTNESKPEFLYSEEQRIALETLIRDGQSAFEDYIRTNNIRCFLSDLELERILSTVEVYCPGSPDNNAELYGESDGEELSLQYWPDRSDCSIPQLDIGWPDRVSYRGVTRVQVYTQPPYEGQSHIKEVVRKMIGHAQKVIAIVMDLFTDIDIFKDLLDASYKRKVAVFMDVAIFYITLVAVTVVTGKRILACLPLHVHTDSIRDATNLRVCSIRGAQFFSRSSKRVCGYQNQKFMFIDGDKAVSGSYRLDRNLITVLTGQAVDTFDTLFQDMYVMSNGVCLSKINLSSEPEPEFLSQVVPTVLPSATRALKLINPKYTLVSNCAFTTNGPVSDQTSAKNSISKNQTEVIKQIKDTPVVPPVHPGLLNLEKANMINYVPTWPDPDPPSDVIGFINIRDSNKPLQAHLMRSELFEVSQAIRFKDPFHEPKESLSLRACPGPISQTPSDPEAPAQKQTSGEAQKNFDQSQHQTSSPANKQSEDLILPSEKPETLHVLACSKVDKEELCVMEKDTFDISTSLQSKNIHTEKDFPNAIPSVPFTQDERVSDTEQTLDTPQPLKFPTQTSDNLDMKLSSAVYNETQCDSFAIPDTPFVKQSLDDQVLIDVATQEHKDTKPETNQNGWNGTQMSNCDSSISSLSDVYYDCFSPVADLRSVGDFFVPEKTQESLHNPIKNGHQEQEVPHSNSSSTQDLDLDNKQTLFTPKLLKTSCSIVFNFLSTEFKTKTAPSETTFAQESDKGVIINDSKQPVKDFSQTPNGCFNFSSTSEEYFECSDTVGLNSDIHMALEKPSSVENFNLNKPLKILKPVLEAEKFSKLSCQNMKEKDEPKIYSGQEQPEFQHILEITADSHIVADEIKAVLGSEDKTQTQLDEKVHRHQEQVSGVTSEPVVESKSMSNFSQEHEISVSQEILEIQTKAESVELFEKVEKEPVQGLQLNVSLDLACKEAEIEPLQDLQSDNHLDLKCERKTVQLPEKYSKPQLQDLKSKVSQVVKCVGQSVTLAEKTAQLPLQDLQPEVTVDLIYEGLSVQLPETTTKPPIQDPQSEKSPDLKLKLSEVNAIKLCLATGSESRNSILQNKEDITSVFPEESEVTKSVELPKTEQLQNPLTYLDSGSNNPPNLKSKEHVNEHLRLQNDEVSPAVLKVNSEEHNPQEKLPEQFETIELLILEDSDPQELNHSDPIHIKRKENQLGHDVNSRNKKETCHPTALIEEKQEGEHICTNQMNKNLPEAKSKLECLVRKQPHQTSSRIPIQARGGLTKLTISKADTSNHSFGLRAPKAGLHSKLPSLGKPLWQNKPSLTLFPSHEKLSTGAIAPVRSTQIPQRPTVPSPNGPISPLKQPQVQLIAPRIRQSDQPNVSRKRSASITKYSCSSSGILCPGQVKKKQAFKGSPPSN
ncbi:Protein FAM83G [Anabarilius grahami]|uniref:Protein FAM83G n=1 Tax=Anabarilius grahami TaxID=495550 RepID=A0A3N0YU57_ANAGA|nr:Protein FAM83G [Anabarilius grahami]